MSSSPTAPPPKEELLRAVRRQNRHAERAREAARAATELRVVELREAAEQCHATMTRLRAERDGGDYALARRRRDEITAEAKRLRKQLFDLRAQTVTEKTKDSSQFKKTRKDLARVLTERSTRMKKATK